MIDKVIKQAGYHPSYRNFNAGGSLNGWMDECRISKGIARWTANFTPPTEAYSPDGVTFLSRLALMGCG